jgi:hypothetical protein
MSESGASKKKAKKSLYQTYKTKGASKTLKKYGSKVIFTKEFGLGSLTLISKMFFTTIQDLVDYNVQPVVGTFIIANMITRKLSMSKQFKNSINKIAGKNKGKRKFYENLFYGILLSLVMYNFYNYVLIWSLWGKMEREKIGFLISGLINFTQKTQVDFNTLIENLLTKLYNQSVTGIVGSIRTIFRSKDAVFAVKDNLLNIYGTGIQYAIGAAAVSVTASISKTIPNFQSNIKDIVNQLGGSTDIKSLKLINPSLIFISKIIQYFSSGMTDESLNALTSFTKEVNQADSVLFAKSISPLLNTTVDSLLNPNFGGTLTSNLTSNLQNMEGYPLIEYVNEIFSEIGGSFQGIGASLQDVGGVVVSSSSEVLKFVSDWVMYLLYYPFDSLVKRKLIEEGTCEIKTGVTAIFDTIFTNSTFEAIQYLKEDSLGKNFINNAGNNACDALNTTLININDYLGFIENKLVPHSVSNFNFNVIFILFIFVAFIIAIFSPAGEDSISPGNVEEIKSE